MISRRASMHHKLKNLLPKDLREGINGQTKWVKQLNSRLVCQLLVVRMPSKCCTRRHKVLQEVQVRRMKRSEWCTPRLMVTSPLESRRQETITGSLTRPSTDLAMENNGYSMEQLCRFITKDLTKVSLRPWLSRRQSRIRKLLLKINLERLRILGRVLIKKSCKTLLSEWRILLQKISGMLPSASTVSRLRESYSLILIWASRPSQVAGTKLESLRMKPEYSEPPQ